MKGQFPSVFNLSALNGQNGFKLDGENNGDNSGFSVSTAGDINDDGYADLIIGAYYYPGSRQGRSYVVFGGPGVGGNGDIALSSLNGANGFKLDGENNLDYSGWSVSTAGDINGDGHADLIIGDNAYSGVIGRNYVLFGGLGVGSSGDIASSSLNGANGFKLDGENIQGYSGISVSGAGDINGDGYDDLLIGGLEPTREEIILAAAMWCSVDSEWAPQETSLCPTLMAPTALNSMAKIMAILAVVPSAGLEILMAMGMPT